LALGPFLVEPAALEGDPVVAGEARREEAKVDVDRVALQLVQRTMEEAEELR
jgi:hypothetical protein